MEQAKTNLGNPQLHKQHSVMIEGGSFPRSRVMDQFIFDRYLMEGLITLSQHRAAEFLLGLAAKAGIWAKGARLDGGFIDTPKGSKVFFGMVPLGNALLQIRLNCGDKHYHLTKNVNIENKDIRKANGLPVFRIAMEYVSDNIIFFHKNPLRHLE